MRALWLHYPSDPEAVKLGDEYLWGRDLLVAPVVEKGAKSRRLYLPRGTWYDWWTGEKQDGPQWLDRPVDLATLPLYARAGSVVPLDPVRQYTAQPVMEPTLLRVYPGEDGVSELYEDDGFSLEYLRGKASWLRFQWRDQDQSLIVEPDPRSKGVAFRTRKFEAALMSTGARKTIEFAGHRMLLRF
jgi:alpha-glucosidase/alpha-D-xyloside xylohydrolase